MKNKKSNYVWTTDVITMTEVYELAIKHGKKEGESIEDEFFEVMKKKKDKFKCLGTTDKDSDLLTGDLREAGLKVLNLNEIERKKNC